MKKLQDYGVQELSTKEIKDTDGGRSVTGPLSPLGYVYGVSKACKEVVKATLGFLAGLGDGIRNAMN